jgi:formylglycine-generating enzyme required for sulfatase activity
MSDFFKKFLLEDPRRFSASGRYVALAAFGKHPGWDDHVEDLGLETESLNIAKTVLYVNGIGGQIDSGAWEKLDASQQLPAFKHVFVWQRSGQILVGRLWSSSDGKGRTRYPMVICLHFMGVTLGWALKHALPALAELEEGCTRTTSAADVRSLLSRKRAALREVIQPIDSRGEYAPVMPEVLHNILHPANAQQEGFLRALYQIQSQLGTFAVGTFSARANPAMIRAQQIRVPVAAPNAEQALLFWTRFFLTQVDAAVPLLLALPLDAGWIDVTAGEPESHEFFSLRASPKAVPLVSEVPYKLDDAFRAKAKTFLDRFQHGETTTIDLKPTAAPALDTATSAKGGWRKWLGVGVIAIIGCVAAIILWPRGEQQQAQTNPPQPKPEVAKPIAKVKDAKPTAKPEVAKPTAKAEGTKPIAKSEVTRPAPVATNTAEIEAAREKARLAAEAEAARLAEEKKKAEAIEAAAKEKERQIAEAARLEKEKEMARQKELEEQQRKAAEEAAKRKSEELARAQAQSASSATPASGEMTNSIGMVLVRLPSGIWVGKYEVTQAEYQKVMGTNPSKSVNDRQPVEKVTWNDAVEFTRKLTERERDKLPSGTAYTLPTEKQWKEFLGGQKFEDLPDNGVTDKGSPGIVGQSGSANKFGLFDVLGNVYEWCLDDTTSGQKVLKGGAFNSANYDRTLLPDRQVSNCGFRCILAAQ